MNCSASDHSSPSPLGGILSAILPGLGHLVRGYPIHLLWVLMAGGLFSAVTWALGAVGGPGVGLFFGMLIILPWWCLQAYQAYLPTPPGQLDTLRIVWKHAHDMRFLGGLFLFTALMDLYIILANPEYHLTVFCTKPTGIPGFLFKAQSPALHIAIGYGFLTLRRWALFVFLAYAGFLAYSMPPPTSHALDTDAFARCSSSHSWLLRLTSFGAETVWSHIPDDPRNQSWLTKVRPNS